LETWNVFRKRPYIRMQRAQCMLSIHRCVELFCIECSRLRPRLTYLTENKTNLDSRLCSRPIFPPSTQQIILLELYLLIYLHKKKSSLLLPNQSVHKTRLWGLSWASFDQAMKIDKRTGSVPDPVPQGWWVSVLNFGFWLVPRTVAIESRFPVEKPIHTWLALRGIVWPSSVGGTRAKYYSLAREQDDTVPFSFLNLGSVKLEPLWLVAIYSEITSTKSPSFCMTTFIANLANFSVPVPQSHVCTFYASRQSTGTCTIQTAEIHWPTRTRLRALCRLGDISLGSLTLPAPEAGDFVLLILL